ncbi:MAG: hypothetical protein K0S46_2249 [Moraxellaceae bacterium]|jgi:hypothetical protein|nr:hypothetical protein [Moraxellaceae bacterium]
MAVMRSRLRAHAVEWHVAPAAHIDSAHRAGFLDLQRRCNSELCRHHALIHNAWLDRLESSDLPPAIGGLLQSLQQLAVFLRRLALAREQHAASLSRTGCLDTDCGTAVVICFDENGVPWCPPLPGMGTGDPHVMSERLLAWWAAWKRSSPEGLKDWSLDQAHDVTRQLCGVVERDYNAADLSTSLGAMMALENAISTDFWQRLGRGLRRCCEALDLKFADAGFFPVAETHARLQARHVLYLVEGASVHDLLDEASFFKAGLDALGYLDHFWESLSGMLQPAVAH